MAETCKRLHLGERSPEQQAATLAQLSPFAVLSYRYMNLRGEYGFSDQFLPPEAPFDIGLRQPLNKPA